MDKALEKIAKEYVEKAEETFGFILALLNVEDKYEMAQLTREKNGAPFLEEGVNYIIIPHGLGCFFSDGKSEIDWDFGDIRTCGINIGLLKRYVDFYYPSLSNEWTYSALKEAFDIASEAGIVECRDSLYYFS